ncbi:hypothetical protein [Planctomicrobium piriforme]|uniref:hypothetical protein n=1 Tax=Planctomicrobium piriforme TaxID=1576369 RepID=UPI000B870D68|nr:hypothetical protein [Planctomicrobium piriforme]
MDQGYNGEKADDAAADQRVELRVIKLPYAKKGFVLLPGAGSQWSHSSSNTQRTSQTQVHNRL